MSSERAAADHFRRPRADRPISKYATTIRAPLPNCAMSDSFDDAHTCARQTLSSALIDNRRPQHARRPHDDVGAREPTIDIFYFALRYDDMQ